MGWDGKGEESKGEERKGKLDMCKSPVECSHAVD